MATIRKKGDYQWHCQIRRKDFPNQTKTFETKADAELWAATIESEMGRGVFRPSPEAENTSLRECLERYLSEIVPLKKSNNREISKVNIIKRHDIANKAMAAIRGADIATYRDKRGHSVAAATVGRELAVISHIFNVARKEWGMESLSNPVEAVRKPKLPKSRDRRLEPGELDRLLETTESLELGTIVLLALETAMRRSEIAGLLRKNVNLLKRTLVLPDTKNGESRTVPLSSRAVELLSSMPTRISGRVFGMAPDSITQAFDRACERAGIDDLRFHDLRHEAASRLFEKGLNPMEVASITGHKTLQMLKRYTHLRAEDLAKKLG